MSYVNNILDRVYKNAEMVDLDQHSKIFFFSDVHKGDKSYSDDFRQNSIIFNHALLNYYKKNYTYIEIGDGIELWENKSFAPIYVAHRSTFKLIELFNQKNKLFLLWGNHDMEFRDPILVEKLYYKYFLPKNLADKKELFNLRYFESLKLNIKEFNKNILVIHGHQADYMNYRHWKFQRFFVRHLWNHLQKWFGIKDPTGPARNYKSLVKVEKTLNNWILKNKNQMVICGHTHRPRFPDPGDIPLFNDGSCVHPNSIIGIEIVDLKISLIKWYEFTDEKSNKNTIKKVILEGPTDIVKFI